MSSARRVAVTITICNCPSADVSVEEGVLLSVSIAWDGDGSAASRSSQALLASAHRDRREDSGVRSVDFRFIMGRWWKQNAYQCERRAQPWQNLPVKLEGKL